MEIGSKWNGWTIEKKLGTGSFGTVYKITKDEFTHHYESALKVISIPQNESELSTIRSEGMDDESVTEYFQSMVENITEELALMAKLKGNTNIVSYEYHLVEQKKDSFGWNVYAQMELLTPLNDYVQNHTLTIREVIQLGIDMCQALEVCQKYNIIHRDIKPENIFVSDLGKFKLGDFGIARQMEKASVVMSKKGTYTYMAPEIYKGLSYNSTVDIYSLGIVLYRFLNNNRTPFMPPYPQKIKYSDREKANVLRISGKAIPKPSNVEGRLAEIVLKACSYNPAERYESAVDMKEALQSISYTEKESQLIYPDGDDLPNDATSTHSNKEEINETDAEKRAVDPTVFLFQSEAEKAKRAAEEKARLEAEERARKVAEEKARKEAEERARRAAEEKARREAEERARREAADRARREAEEKARREAEELARKQAEEKARKKAEERARLEAIERAKKEEEERKKREAEERARKAAEEKAKLEAEKKAKKEAAEKARKEAEEQKRKATEEKARIATKKKADKEAKLVAKREAAEKAKTEAEKLKKEENKKQTPASTKDGENKKSKKWFVIVGVSVAVVIAIIVIVIIVGQNSDDSSSNTNTTSSSQVSQVSYVYVPDVEGESRSTAVNELHAQGLEVDEQEEYSDTISEGNVISQSPSADTQLKEGATVTIIVSKGEKLYKVPDVKGLSESKAMSKLENAHLKAKAKKAYSNSVKKGKVIKQSIVSGEQVKKNTTVSITVSKGAKPTASSSSTTNDYYYDYDNNNDNNDNSGNSSSGLEITNDFFDEE